jgi:hypothetical protein
MDVRRWFRSRRGKNIIITVLGLGLIISILGQAVGWSDLGRLVTGTAGPGMGGYSCMPTCVENDGKFLSMPGEDMASFGGAKIVLWIAAPVGQDAFELGIFDGDSGKDDEGNLSLVDGNWDTTETENTYTLYADPYRDGTGATVVGEWRGNADPMPNNDWYDLTIDNVEQARNPNGTYYYRLECTRPVEGSGNGPFKLRSTGQLSSGRSDLVDANFAIIGGIGTGNDIPILWPEYAAGSPFEDWGPSTYTGSWEFYFDVPAGTETIEFWDGDFDRGTASDIDDDTDDPNTVGKPAWALPSAVDERAGGKGAPADDIASAFYRREPAVRYKVIGPEGQPIFTNDEPSGTEEWEKFVVSSDPDLPDEAVDLRVDDVPTGMYTLKVQGLDLYNSVWFRMNYAIGEDPCPPCPTCPECPECPPCEPEPTATPLPTPTPEPTPLPEPEPCEDALPIDLLYVLDVSGSMDQLYAGPGTKLMAAQNAILELNDWVDEQNNGSRVALLTFHGAGRGRGNPALYPPDLKLVSDFTGDIDGFNEKLATLDASGSTPTAHALGLVANHLPDRLDPDHVPVILLVSDGVPTVDLDEHGFADKFVQKVSLYDDAGDFLSPAQVRNKGAMFQEYGEKAGEPLADAMLAIQKVKEEVADAQVHAVAVQAVHQGIFNDDILQYVAEVGDGEFFMSEDAEELVKAFQWAFVDSACEEGTGDGSGSGGEPEPTPTDEPEECENLRTNRYNIEITNRPYYGIKFEYQSGTEIKRGDYDEFSFTLTADEAAAMDSVRIGAKAGRAQGATTITGCDFDGPDACDPVSDSRFTFTFLGAEDNGDGTLTLTFRVQNDRRRGLSHVLIGLDDDVVPSSPTGSYEAEVCLD